MIRKSLVDARLSVSGVTAWVTSAISRATMQNDLKLLPLTMRAPPSVTSSTARIFHDLEGAVPINYSLILVKRQFFESGPLFFKGVCLLPRFLRGRPEFFSHFQKTRCYGCLPRECKPC